MRKLVPACLAFLVVACGPAETPQSSPAATTQGLTITDAWSPVSPNGVDVGAGYLTINNDGPADTLIGVSSPRAQSVEIHEMSSDGPVMRMRAVQRLEIPAHSGVALAPGGLHLMFHGLDRPFTAGESVPARLTFEYAGARDITLSIRARNEGHGQH